MLIQAYDFWHLYRTERCELQMGGSDQWGNITAGIELIGRREGAQVHGLVFPLITTASGAKFGKSEAGNVWLDPARTSPYQFYQFWVNTDDRDVERYLKLFTFLRLDQIAAAMAEHGERPGERRTAQRLLAREVTATVHGVEAAEQAVRTSAALFRRSAATSRRCRTCRPAPWRGPRCWSGSDRRSAGGERPGQLQGATRGGASRAAGSISTARRSSGWTRCCGADDLHGPAEEPFVILRKGKKNYVRLVLSTVDVIITIGCEGSACVRGGLTPSIPNSPRTISRPTVRPMDVESAPTTRRTSGGLPRSSPHSCPASVSAPAPPSPMRASGLPHPRRQHLARALPVHRLAVLREQVRLPDVGLQLLGRERRHARGRRDQPGGDHRRRASPARPAR